MKIIETTVIFNMVEFVLPKIQHSMVIILRHPKIERSMVIILRHPKIQRSIYLEKFQKTDFSKLEG